MRPPKRAATGSEDREKFLVESGTHLARCVGISYIGSVDTKSFNDPTKIVSRHKILMTFELSNQTYTYKKDEKEITGRKDVTTEYTFSYHKSNLKRDIESWIGRPLTEEEIEGDHSYDLKSLLNKECFINVSLNETKAGKTYNKVNSVIQVPKGMDVPPAVNILGMFNIYDYPSVEKLRESEAYKKMNGYVKFKLNSSNEYKQLLKISADAAVAAKPASGTTPSGTEQSSEKGDDDLPF